MPGSIHRRTGNSRAKQNDRLGAHTLEVVREDLVEQFRPEWAGVSLRRNFSRFLEQLSDEEVDERRRRLGNGQIVFVHRDKWLTRGAGLREVQRMGVGGRAGGQVPEKAR